VPILEVFYSVRSSLTQTQKTQFAAESTRIFEKILGTPEGRLRLFFRETVPEDTIELLLYQSQDEKIMLILRLSMIAGRSEEARADLLCCLSEAASHHLDFPLDKIRMLIYEVPATNWGVGGISMAERQRK
jgi:4-oxalocrotonate tautomerase